MFFVYRSNQIDILFTKICKIIKKKPLLNIFEREIIIHDNEILFQNLNTFIANHTGIAADFKLIYPNVFIWKLFKQVFSDIQLNNIFSRSTITWKIMKIIEENDFCKFVQKKDKIMKKFEFSFLMSHLYQQYILYRPNWINMWEKNKKNTLKIEKKDEWQAKLWIKIILYTEKLQQSKWHFSNLFKKFKTLKKIEHIKFPKRIFIIYSISLNPKYMEIFKKISTYTDIYFLSINACEKEIFHISFAKNYVVQKNNLLMNLSEKYEKFYFLFFKKFKKIKYNNFFQKNNSNNLLNIVKNDFLNFKEKENLLKKNSFLLKDNSISINICCDKKHEIEVLYNKLLSFFNEDSKLKPSDIVITSFSLNTYIIYINSIFKSKNKKEKIPFYISKKHSDKIEKILFIFNKILNLPNIRCNNEEILDLIEIQDIRDKFDISEEEINILYEWIEKANIRWGLHENEKQKNNLIFIKKNQNTWFYGIKKLLISHAINEEEEVWNNVLSCTSINTSRTELIGKLINFIKVLDQWRDKLFFSKKIKSWRPLFLCFIKDFFCKNEKIRDSIDIINKTWTKMIDDATLSNYEKKIPISILKKKFSHIMNNFSEKKFLPGVINFCHPSLVCYIPFKIKCIIGAEYQEIPKKKLSSFNLIDKYPLTSDLHICKENYIFLQNFISTQETLYISYVGHSLKNNNKVRSSILIDQLLNHITSNFYVSEHHDYKNNKKEIFEHICKKHKKENLYEKKQVNKINLNTLQKTKKINQEIYNKIFSIKNRIISTSTQISLKSLISFWKNPIRYFFNYTLNIKLKIAKRNIITEPFSINLFDDFKISNIIFKKILNNESIKDEFKKIILSGILPYGHFGSILLKEKKKEIENIVKAIYKYRISSPKKENFDIKIEKYNINGCLDEIQNTGLLRWKLGTINYRDRISLWLEHLIYCILGGTGESKIIGYKKNFFSFYPLSSHLAYNYLFTYIEGYMKGMKNPLLLIKSGSNWFDKVYDKKNDCIKKNDDIKRKAYKILYHTWMGNEYITGEKEDLYIQQIISELNVKKICKISQKWFTPILKHQKK